MSCKKNKTKKPNKKTISLPVLADRLNIYEVLTSEKSTEKCLVLWYFWTAFGVRQWEDRSGPDQSK